MIDYRRPFVAIRKDPRWKRKIGLGVLIGLIPYVGLVWLLGWEMQYQRAVVWGQDECLPEWSDFKNQMQLGLYGIVAVMPYSLLASLVATPLSIFAAFAIAYSGSAEGDLAMVVGLATAGASFLLTYVLVILMIPFSSAAMLRVAIYGSLGSGLQIKEILRLMREYRREVTRASWLCVVNMLIPLVEMAFGFGGLALLFFAGSAIDEAWTVPVIVLSSALLYLAFIVVGSGVGLVLGLANSHYFAHYGRVAYGIDAARISASPAAVQA